MKLRKLLRALDPRHSLKLWTVELSDWTGGTFRSFWKHKNAMKFVKANWSSTPFIDLRNENTGKKIRLKDNPDKIPVNVVATSMPSSPPPASFPPISRGT